MSEGPGGDLAKLGERFMEGVPGFALVTIVLGAVLPFVLQLRAAGPSESVPLKMTRQALPIIVLVLAWIGYFLGHYLDPLLFDPIWGVPGIRNFRKGLRRILFFEWLDQSRNMLADQWERPVTGIFAKAQDLMNKTELWDKRIKWPLEWSKAFRSLAILGVVALALWCPWRWILLIFLFSFILLFVHKARRLTSLKTLVFATTLVCLLTRPLLPSDDIQKRSPLIPSVMTALSVSLYLGLRIIHVRTLYEGAQGLELEECGGMFCAGEKVTPMRNVLLIADAGVRDEVFHRADCFVQSKALMHVKLTTIRSSNYPSSCKTRIQLFKSQLECVQTARQAYRSPDLNLSDLRKFDLVIEYFDRDAPDGQELRGFEKKLNGVI